LSKHDNSGADEQRPPRKAAKQFSTEKGFFVCNLKSPETRPKRCGSDGTLGRMRCHVRFADEWGFEPCFFCVRRNPERGPELEWGALLALVGRESLAP
jgi:hypothetical protein